MPADAVAREQHAVVAAEEPALVHGGDVDPVRVRLDREGDLGRVQADVVVAVLPRERVHAVGPQRESPAVASAVALRSARSSATSPPSTTASLPSRT